MMGVSTMAVVALAFDAARLGVTLDDLQIFQRLLAPRTFEVAQALVKIRSAPQAMNGFPDLEALLWLDVGLMAETLDLKLRGPRGTPSAPELEILARRRMIDYQFGTLKKRPAVGFRFRPFIDWSRERDVGAWPLPGDRIVRPVLDRPDRQVCRSSGAADAVSADNPDGRFVMWLWVGSKYPAVQHRMHLASREEWASWVRTAVSVTRAEDVKRLNEESSDGH